MMKSELVIIPGKVGGVVMGGVVMRCIGKNRITWRGSDKSRVYTDYRETY